MKRIFLLILSMLLLSGCVNRVDYNQKSLDLSLGMTKQSVQSIMGQPRRTDVNQERERWIYWNPVMVGFTPVDNEQLAQDRLVVTFVDGKVIKWGKQTLADDIMDNTQKIYQQSLNSVSNSPPQTK